MVPGGDPSVAAYHGFQSIFGNDEQVLTNLVADALNAETFAADLSAGFVAEEQEGVARAIARPTRPLLIQTRQTSRFRRWKRWIFLDRSAPMERRCRATAAARLDEKTTLMIVQMQVIDDFDAKRDALLLQLQQS